MPVPWPPSAKNSTGKPVAVHVLADRRGARGDLVARARRAREPGEVALDVGGEDRDAGGGELLGQQLQGLGLAGAGRPRHQPVPVEHRRAGSGSGRRTAWSASSISPPSSSAGPSKA